MIPVGASMSDSPHSAFRVPRSALDRRGFLRLGLAAGAGALLRGAPAGAGADRARVAVATGGKLFADDRTLRAESVRQLVDAAVGSVMGETNPAEAWKRLVRPDDVVGIKVNCLAGERLSTRIEVVRAIAAAVANAGVPGNHIIVWDRYRNDLVRAQYPASDRSRFLCMGNDDCRFEERLTMQGEIGSFFSRFATELCSVIINVPVFKDHDLAGVSLSLKSAFGAIHNPNKYHLGNLQQAIADVNRVACLRRKTAIHICDATFGCYHTGPTPKPQFIERLGTIFASRDPVALDTVAWQKIEELRKAHNLETLAGSKRDPRHIALAAEAHIGVNDPARIDVVKVEV